MIKPPYRVPTVAETAVAPRSGLTVVSTFSGGGGSCYGYELAGYEVLWANEFVPSAQATYQANHPKTILDVRDIRAIDADDVLAATGLGRGELSLFDGSPPCQLFSTSGKREKGWNKQVEHADGAVQRSSDDLFFEYARLLRGLQPAVFIAENVSGLVKGTAKGYFKLILQSLRDCGYQVEARLIDASWLGVPQRRQRLIFQGVRTNLQRAPVWPKPFAYSYSVNDVTVGLTIPDDDKSSLEGYAYGREWSRLRPGQKSDKYLNLVRSDPDRPVQTIVAAGGQMANVTHPSEMRRFTIPELKRLSSFPDDYVLTGTYVEQWARLGNSVPPLMMKAIAEVIRDEILVPVVEREKTNDA